MGKIDEQTAERNLTQLVRHYTNCYIQRRMQEKYDLGWAKGANGQDGGPINVKTKAPAERSDYDNKKTSLIEKAFLDIRGIKIRGPKTGKRFVDYFAENFTPPQSEKDYESFSRYLLDNPVEVRELTLLSLASYIPRTQSSNTAGV